MAEKRCKICKVQAILDKNGRCKSCADAKKATDMGISYGELKRREYVEEEKQKRLQQAVEHAWKRWGK